MTDCVIPKERAMDGGRGVDKKHFLSSHDLKLRCPRELVFMFLIFKSRFDLNPPVEFMAESLSNII